jgi:glycosyltransferase involved in cell wall biosynthesis
MARVVSLVANPCVIDARVLKAANAAAEAGHEVHIFATTAPGVPPFEMTLGGIRIHRLDWKLNLMMRRQYFLLRLLHKIHKKLASAVIQLWGPYVKYCLFSSIYLKPVMDMKPDLIHAHELITLPTAAKAARKTGARLVYDSHELERYRDQRVTFLQRLWIRRLENTYSKAAGTVVTVGDRLGDYLKKFIKRDDIAVIYNTPLIAPCPRNIRDDLRMDASVPLMVFVGNITTGRGLDKVLPLVSQVPGMVLATVGPQKNKQILNELKRQASRLKLDGSRLRFLPSVPWDQVVSYITGADIGIIANEPLTLSYVNCMPNKLFEMAFAGVPMLVNSQMAAIFQVVTEYHLGLALDFDKDTSCLPHAIGKILREKTAFVMDAERVAAFEAKYSWEAQRKRLLSIYQNLLEAGDEC